MYLAFTTRRWAPTARLHNRQRCFRTRRSHTLELGRGRDQGVLTTVRLHPWRGVLPCFNQQSKAKLLRNASSACLSPSKYRLRFRTGQRMRGEVLISELAQTAGHSYQVGILSDLSKVPLMGTGQAARLAAKRQSLGWLPAISAKSKRQESQKSRSRRWSHSRIPLT